MSEKKKTHGNRSETRKIKCRVSGCGIDILEKNDRQYLIHTYIYPFSQRLSHSR